MDPFISRNLDWAHSSRVPGPVRGGQDDAGPRQGSSPGLAASHDPLSCTAASPGTGLSPLLNFSFHSLQPLFAHCLFILTSGRCLLPAHPTPRAGAPPWLFSAQRPLGWPVAGGICGSQNSAGLPLMWQLSSVGESRCNLARVFPCCERVTPQYRVFRMVSAWVND